jgi:predicted DNA-binding mobile mystery protein A
MKRQDPLTREIERSRLDGQLAALRTAQRKGGLRRPRRGWVRAVRDALGMNGRQLAERMRIARSQLAQIEDGELRGATSLRTMECAAEALGCEFVYAFVPRDGKSLEALIAERAGEVAAALVQRVGTSMALEAQGVEDASVLKKEIERVAAELVRTGSRELWEP